MQLIVRYTGLHNVLILVLCSVEGQFISLFPLGLVVIQLFVEQVALDVVVVASGRDDAVPRGPVRRYIEVGVLDSDRPDPIVDGNQLIVLSLVLLGSLFAHPPVHDDVHFGSSVSPRNVCSILQIAVVVHDDPLPGGTGDLEVTDHPDSTAR